MRALLCIPPNYCFTYDFPPLGTPMLAGFLKKMGIDVIQSDMNMEYLYYLTQKSLSEKMIKNLTTIEAMIISIKTLNKMYDIKRSKNYYYSDLLQHPLFPHPNYNDNTNSSFYFTERLLSSEYLLRYIDDEKENIFLTFFNDEKILKKIEDEKINILAISIIAPSQVLGAFTLGRMVKKYLPYIHVTIGGQWPTLFRNALIANPSWNIFFDTVITFEGETPLYKLIKCLETKGRFSDVPNLIYHEGSRWIKSYLHSKENLNELACPDFDDLPLKKYQYSKSMNGTSPTYIDTTHLTDIDGTHLTYQTSRDCSWNKCIYCVDLPLPKQGYRERSPELVIKDLKTLIRKYDMRYLTVSNATFAPTQMKRISELIIKEGLKFSWWTFTRLDKGLTKRTLAIAKKAGCACMIFGLESANQRVLDFINKGIDLNNARQIIQNSHNAGLATGLQLMLGIPSETVEEATDTITFLLDNHKYIDIEVSFNIYYITPSSEVFLNPFKYGINIKKNSNLPFQFFHDFSDMTGEISGEIAAKLITTYKTLLKRITTKNNSKIANIKNTKNHKYSSNLKIGDDVVSFEIEV